MQYLGEDMELARRLLAHGDLVEMVPHPVGSRARGRSLRMVLERYVRWLIVIRAQRPWLVPTYPLLIAAYPLALLVFVSLGVAIPLIAIDSGATRWLQWAVGLLVLIGTRVLVTRTSAAALKRRDRGGMVSMSMAVIADVALLVALVHATVRRRIRWRDNIVKLGKNGRLSCFGSNVFDAQTERALRNDRADSA